jgi:hypothetical protein
MATKRFFTRVSSCSTYLQGGRVGKRGEAQRRWRRQRSAAQRCVLLLRSSGEGAGGSVGAEP